MSDNQHATETTEQTGPAGSGRDATRALRRATRQAHLGKFVEAIGSLEAAIRLGADPYQCYLQQARLYQSLGQWREAVQTARKAVRRKPRQVQAHEAVIAILLESREFDEAIRAIENLLRIAPKHVGAREALGIAYMGLGDYDAALRVINESIRMYPEDPAPRFKRAMIYEHRGHTQLAVAELETVVNTSEDEKLADMAREHLESLDLAQVHDILLLASEDAVFRMKLVQNTALAVLERGFWLSDWGLRRLAEIAAKHLADYTDNGPLGTYH